MMRTAQLLLLLAATVRASESQVWVASAGAPCKIEPFQTHHCTQRLTNLTSAAIKTADACSAACCAATKFTCTTAQWHAADGVCLGGDVCLHASRDRAWTTFLVNYTPKPPAPSGLKCVYPHGPRFGIEACGLANGVGGYDDHAARPPKTRLTPRPVRS